MGNKFSTPSTKIAHNKQTNPTANNPMMNTNTQIVNVNKRCDINKYSWKKNEFDMMRELGLSPMTDPHGFEIKQCDYNTDNILQVNMDNEYFVGSNNSKGRSWLIYNAGLKTSDMTQYTYNLECAPNQSINYILSIYHRQEVGWIIQYMLGLIDGMTNKYIKIGDEVGIGVHQTGYCTSKHITHYMGTFASPSETGIYFVIWPTQLQYSMRNALNCHAKQIGNDVPEKYYRKIIRISVGISYSEFCSEIAPFILKECVEFETLIPTLFSYISCRSIKE
eukprot:38926_1